MVIRKMETRSSPLTLGAAALVLGCALAAVSGFSRGADPADEGGRARETRCGGGGVVVHAADHADARLACDGAADAIGFLAAQGLDVSGEVAIDVVQRLPAAAGASAAGCYLDPERRVLVLSFAEFRKFKTWLNLPIDARIYRSLVSHEVAHAVAACNFRIARPSIQAKEYIAYVTMFATMAPGQRELVLAQFPGPGFEGDWQMGTTVYMLDPLRFGAQAYRHFLNPGNGRDYLHAILAGKVLIE